MVNLCTQPRDCYHSQLMKTFDKSIQISLAWTQGASNGIEHEVRKITLKGQAVRA